MEAVRHHRTAPWLAAAVAVLVLLAVADATFGRVAGTFVVAPLLLAVAGAPRLAAAVGAAAVALAAFSAVWHDNLWEADWWVRLAFVVTGSALAVAAARQRLRAEALSRATASVEAVAGVVDVAPTAVIGIDGAGRVTSWNPAAEELLGRPAEAALGEELAELAVPPELRPAHWSGLRRVAGGGPSAVLGHRLEVDALHADGHRIPVELSITRLPGPDPAFAGFLRDLTEERRRALHQRLLAGTAELLSASTDLDRTLRAVARLSVPDLADWCGVVLRTTDGSEAVASAPPDLALAERVRAGDGERLTVPLQGSAGPVGTLTLARVAGPPFDAADEGVAAELGRRAGAAVEAARLYAERSDVAATLTAAVQPPRLPAMPGWDVASLFRPASRTSEVGGDFYDVFPVRGGWVVVVGDVTGKGAPAAALTSLARWSIRTAATITGSPGAALAQLNAELAARDQPALVSAACVLLCDGDDGAARAVVAAGGHPLPVLVGPGGAREVGRTGVLPGVAPGLAYAEDEVVLAPGDGLVLYTDGVTDLTGATERFGERRLLEALAEPAPSAEALLGGLAARLVAFLDGPQPDDIAAVVVRRAAGG